MQGSYAAWISEASRLLAQAVLESETDLAERAREADGIVQGPAREMCRLATEMVLNAVSRRLTGAARKEGLQLHRRKRVRFFGLYGPMEVDSPYLYDGATGRSARPVKDQLGITHQGRSQALTRALTDFGAEESFGHAAQRFAEHYGFPVHRTTVMRVTEAEASVAEAYVRARLASDRAALGQSLWTRAGADRMLAELDGCEIRTGTLEPVPMSETTSARGSPRRRRVEQWREVRVGLARRLDELEPTYVAAMAPYPEVVSSLVDAAVSHGLSARTETLAVADGGNGLKEELEVQFPRLTFILDRPHVQKHLYEAAEAMGLENDTREDWVRHRMEAIDAGHVRDLIAELRRHQGEGHETTRRLADYLNRFRDCVHYDAYKARGLPIGSGHVESAHRSIPQKRLKLPGASWSPDTLNPMRALRVLRANGWWEDFWSGKSAA